MIGQKNLIQTIDSYIENNNFPRFLILVGAKGSGKSTLVDYIQTKLHITRITCDAGVESVREVVSYANTTTSKLLYHFVDADKMTVSARTAMLKFTEEPPEGAYIIMTIENINHISTTLQSRGVVHYMEQYSPEELIEFAKMNLCKSKDYALVQSFCEVPSEVEYLVKADPQKVYDFVIKIVDNIDYINKANALKIAQYINFKDDEDKYDLRMVWKIFLRECFNRVSSGEESLKYAHWVTVTSDKMQRLDTINGINKLALFDSWVLDLKKAGEYVERFGV